MVQFSSITVPGGNVLSPGMTNVKINITYPDELVGDYSTRVAFNSGINKVTVPVYMTTKILFIDWDIPVFCIYGKCLLWLHVFIGITALVIISVAWRSMK